MIIWEYEIRSKAFIIESNRILREVTIVRKNSDFYIVRFDNNGSIQLRKSRIFPTREAAKQHLSKNNCTSQTSWESITISALALKGETF